MADASCITSQFGSSTCPQLMLKVDKQATLANKVYLMWELVYVAHGYAATATSARSYNVKINGAIVKSGTFDINGKKTNYTIATGLQEVPRTASTSSISFSCSIDFNITWSGVYGGLKSASGMIPIDGVMTYKITYNANSGTGGPGSQNKTHDVNITIPTTTPTKSGYKFLGWGTSSISTTISYRPGDIYSKNASATLYAIWSETSTSDNPPVLSRISVERCDASGRLTDDGTYALVSFYWNSKVPIQSIIIEWKHYNDPDFISSISVNASGTSGYVNQIVGGSFSKDSDYVVRIIATDDNYSSTDITRIVSTSGFEIDLLAGGGGMAIGKSCEYPGLDVNYKSTFRKDLFVSPGVKIYGETTHNIYRTVNVFTPVDQNGDLVVGYDNYNYNLGNLKLYGKDIEFGVGSLSTKYKPYYSAGDRITVFIRTAGFITSAGQSLSFTIPLVKPIIGSAVVAATSLRGFLLRQNGVYTSGSSATNYVIPDSYSVERYEFGLVVAAKFSNTFNVTNNDTMGITWHGIIELY